MLCAAFKHPTRSLLVGLQTLRAHFNASLLCMCVLCAACAARNHSLSCVSSARGCSSVMARVCVQRGYKTQYPARARAADSRDSSSGVAQLGTATTSTGGYYTPRCCTRSRMRARESRTCTRQHTARTSPTHRNIPSQCAASALTRSARAPGVQL